MKRSGSERVFHRVRGVGVREKEERAGFGSVVTDVAKSYCEITVLHGVKYLAEPRRTVWERLAWAVVLGAFVGIGVHLLWVSAQESLSRPVIINLDTSYHPIWNFAFPAITICPLNKLNKTLAKNWTNSVYVTLPSGMKRSDLLGLLPNILRLIDPADSKDLHVLQAVFDANNVTAHAVYSQVSVQCKDFLVSCRLGKKTIACKHLFRTIRTSEGYCCSYNYFGVRSKFNMLLYHVPSEDSPRQPVRMSSSGKESGLSVVVRMQDEDNLGTLMSSRGAKLLIHKPLNYPDHLTIEKLVQAGRAVSYGVTPELINATSEVRSVPLSNRDCYFFDEMELYSVQSYSYKNCILNCRIDYYIKQCGCVPFIYPIQEKYRVCTLQDNQCLVDNRYVLQTLRENVTDLDGQESAPCSCRPQCNDITYSVATSSALMAKDTSLFTNAFYDGITDPQHHSLISIYFRSHFATKYQRLVFYTCYKLLAAFGGLLGLFMGFSFIAAFETAYTFTLRVLFYLYLARRTTVRQAALAPPLPPPQPAAWVILGAYRRVEL